MAHIMENGRYYPVQCDVKFCSAYICEFKAKEQKSLKGIALKTQLKGFDNLSQHNLIACPSGHITYELLHCDVKSYCVYRFPEDTCVEITDTKNTNFTDHNDGLRVEMFECAETRETIPYTLVCDFRHHCLGGADEYFCVHPNHQHGFRLVLKIDNQK